MGLTDVFFPLISDASCTPLDAIWPLLAADVSTRLFVSSAGSVSRFPEGDRVRAGSRGLQRRFLRAGWVTNIAVTP